MTDKLTPDELAAYRQLRAGVDNWKHLNKKQTAWCDEACLLRYLRARKYDAMAAKNMLAETLEWRFIDAKPQKIKHQDVTKIASCMSNYFHMHTADGHPVCYMRFARDPPGFTNEEKLQYMMFNLEEACRILDSDHFKQTFPNGNEKMSYIIDLSEFSLSAPGADTGLAKAWVNVLSKHYPERLHEAHLVNYPGIFSTFWSLVSVFVDPVTARKVNWAPPPPSGADAKAHFRAYFESKGFPPGLLEEAFGGDIKELDKPNFIQAATYSPYPMK